MRKGARKEVTQDELDESGIKDQSESGSEDFGDGTESADE